MTSKDDNQFWFPAWGISVILHGAVVGVAIVFVSQVKPVLQDETFRWDVALVEEATPDSKSEQASSVVASAQPSVKKLLPSRPTSVPETSQPVMPVEQKIESPPPMIEQKVEIPQVRKEPVEPRLVEKAEPNAEPKVEQVLESKESERVTVAASPDSVQAQPAQREVAPGQSALTPMSEIPPAQDASAQASSSTGGVDAPALQMAKAPASDHRWLAESLWRRVAELKRYPNSARMNGQEGKVILKAIIRSDGQLADVFVQKSSGHSVLDAAAIEAVKIACPLPMKHAIGKPQIVVSLPIVYSLAN
jgi:protein TonB